MSVISYELARASSSERLVYLDGKHIGDIKPVAGGFCYYPKSASGKAPAGEVFATVAEVKRSLEAE